MNREEAITALGDRNNLLWGMSKEEQEYYSKALDMAISALSAEPTCMIEKSNFSQEQYKADLQCAYDCGKASVSAEGEYIKKEDILNELGDTNMDILTDEVKEIVNGLPTYSFPDREKGEWISREGTGECFPFWERHKCSKCGKYGEGTFNFCPNCGADMRGGDK